MAAELSFELQRTLTKLVTTISLFTDEDFNVIPFDNSWTPAQVCDHILKSCFGIIETLHNPTHDTTRKPDAKEPELRSIFLDFRTKMKSPEVILPSTVPIQKEEILRCVQELKVQVENAVQSLDMTATTIGFELPGMGAFTRLEWLYFFLYHTQRHIHQLEKIQRVLQKV